MEYIILIVLYLLYVGMYSSFGAVEAVLWARKGSKSFKWDEHDWILVPQRIWFGLTIMLSGYCASRFGLDMLYVFFSSIPAFFFFHQGTMYMVRNHINILVYPDRWKDDSTTSSADINVKWAWRVILFIMSILLLIMIIWLKNLS